MNRNGDIVHRSKYMILTNLPDEYVRRRKNEVIMNKIQGWNSPADKPYKPFGKFSNVLYVLDAVKRTIPHSQKIATSTEKSIRSLK